MPTPDALLHTHGPSSSTAHVFFHALPGAASDFERVVAARPEARSVLVDLPDFGDAPDAEVDLDALVDAAERAIASVEAERLRLVGQSFGAWLVARLLPALGDRAERAVLIGGFPRMPADIVAVRVQMREQLERGELTVPMLTDACRPLFLGTAEPAPEARALVDRQLARVDAGRWRRYLRRTVELGEEGVEPAPYDTPTAVLHGTGDAAVPVELGRALAALGRRARFEAVDTDAHGLSFTHPELVARVVFD